MNILIRLPNWLGDMVMSTAFVQAVKEHFPAASIDLIAKNGLDFLLDYFPTHRERYVFSKEEYKGLIGAVRFGQFIRSQKKYDLFFCLPDSFSSAIMGYAIGAKKRVGFKKELRSALLTHSYQKKKGVHRVEEYIDLLQQYAKEEIPVPPVQLSCPAAERKNALIININSEASSRRLPKEKAIQFINAIRNKINAEIILVGSNKEKDFVDEVYADLAGKNNISNMAGQTNMQQLVTLMSSCPVILTTDSGPAHVANALGVHTIVLFGAGNENNTAPYNKKNRSIIRLGQLDCEPCVSNTCKLYGIPQCLLRLDETLIASEVYNVLK
jgi:lipopolysaccharide heptosyltransferase II